MLLPGLPFAFLVFMISGSKKIHKSSTTCSCRLVTICLSNEVELFFPPLKYTVNIISLSEQLHSVFLTIVFVLNVNRPAN